MTPVLLPTTCAELWGILDRSPEAALYAGGTDLLVKLRQGIMDPPALVCLERVEELKSIEEEQPGVLAIGAGVTLQTLMDHPRVKGLVPVLAQAVKVLGSPPIRHMGTLGGNICTASPAADTLPPLYALKAEVEIRSRLGSRRLPLREFILAPGKTALQSGELLARIIVPAASRFTVHHYEKVGQRKALAISIVSMSALLRLSDSGIIEQVRLAWGSVAPTVVTSPEVEAHLSGNLLSRPLLEDAQSLVHRAVSPIDDLRASAEYRRAVAGNLLFRLLSLCPTARAC